MKKRFLLTAVALACGSIFFIARADHSHGSGTRHSDGETENADSKNKINLSEQTQIRLAIEVAEIETQEVTGSEDTVIAVPLSSIVTENGKTYVFAQSETDKTQFEKWEVQLGMKSDQFVEALSGVFPGDKLIVSGVDYLTTLGNEDAVDAKNPIVREEDQTFGNGGKQSPDLLAENGDEQITEPAPARTRPETRQTFDRRDTRTQNHNQNDCQNGNFYYYAAPFRSEYREYGNYRGEGGYRSNHGNYFGGGYGGNYGGGYHGGYGGGGYYGGSRCN